MLPQEIVFRKARVLARMRTASIARRARTLPQICENPAPRMIIAREILMKCVAGRT
jgi:hypothetical protein